MKAGGATGVVAVEGVGGKASALCEETEVGTGVDPSLDPPATPSMAELGNYDALLK